MLGTNVEDAADRTAGVGRRQPLLVFLLLLNSWNPVDGQKTVLTVLRSLKKITTYSLMPGLTFNPCLHYMNIDMDF